MKPHLYLPIVGFLLALLLMPAPLSALGAPTAPASSGRVPTAQAATPGGLLRAFRVASARPNTLVLDHLSYLEQKVAAANGAVLAFFGFAVALEGDTALVGAIWEETGGDPRGAAYVFTRNGTTWSLQQKLIAADGATWDCFGSAVALADDTALVGAVQDDVGANDDQGSAYVFTRDGTTWSLQQKLTAADGAAGDYFGYAVALTGDTALVGASQDDVGADSNQGSAYVFTRDGTAWTSQQQLTASDGSAEDMFGHSVAVAGDTALVGAVQDGVGANSNQGSAYVFTRGGTVWTPQQQLTAADGASGDYFGIAVALADATALVGAFQDDVGATGNQGSAYVFTRTGTNWTLQQQLTAADGAADDMFGYSVALAGDLALVGAWQDDIGFSGDQGSAYSFARSGTTWTPQSHLTASDGAAGDQFGSAVALSGNTALAAADIDDVGTNIDQGSAYFYYKLTYALYAPLTSSNSP